jgi:hypothetical protein
MWRRHNRIAVGVFTVWSIVVGATLFAVTLLTMALSSGEEIFYLMVLRPQARKKPTCQELLECPLMVPTSTVDRWSLTITPV